MHRLIKIRIIKDLERLEERTRCWRERLFPLGEVELPFRPAADLYETPDCLVLRMEIPGADKEDVSIDLAGQELIVRGKRRPLPPADINRVLLYEMTYGSFERSFHIPVAVDPEAISASYKQGILEVRLPRHRPRPRVIPVREIHEDQD
jgi:HSP20 family protein